MRFYVVHLFVFFSFYVCVYNLRLIAKFEGLVADVADDPAGSHAPLATSANSTSMKSSNDSMIEPEKVTYIAPKPTAQIDPQLTSTECRIAWDKKRKDSLINSWLTLAAPILIGPIRHREVSISQREALKDVSVLSDDIIYVIFTQAHLAQSNLIDFNWIEWMCSYDKGLVLQKAVLAPRNRNKGRGHVILICNSTAVVPTTNQANAGPSRSFNSPHRLLDGVFPTRLLGPSGETPDPHTVTTMTSNSTMLLYDLQEPLHCDHLEHLEHYVHKDVHHNKGEEAKIGACLRFRGDFDRAHVPEWIEYHRLLGFQHFWVYINEKWDVSGLYNHSDVTYLPFDLHWPDHASHFAYPYSNNKPKLSQEPASWHCLYSAKKYGYDWIVTTDVDEYIYVPKNISGVAPHSPPVSSTSSSNPLASLDASSSSPIHSYLSRFSPQQYSSLVINSIPFGSNKFMNDSQTQNDTSASSKANAPLMIDYVWRQNKPLSEYAFERYKQFYNPQTVWSIGVHFCWFASGNGVMDRRLNPHDDRLFLAHYKLSEQGVFRKGNKLMVKSLEDLQLDLSLRDDYRNELVEGLRSTKLHSSSST